jgi:curved DNA-binding protein CbpA
MQGRHSVRSDDFYERLGVPRTAAPDDIKRAYRALVRQYPPERAPEEFKRIREAYETLASPSARHDYDWKPDPAIESLIGQARKAMDSKAYEAAERHFKQVLVLAPDLHYIRNMLGLCLMYQEKPAEALHQFLRLTTLPDPPPFVFGNAGHAYRGLRRFEDAERAFAEAIGRASDGPVDYYVGLADVLIVRQGGSHAGEGHQRRWYG